MRNFIVLFTPCLMMFAISCNSQSVPKNFIRGFDISNDDKRILFAIVENGHTSIREVTLHSDKDKVLMRSEENKFYSNPKYSPDGQKIVYIEHDLTDRDNSSLCVASSDGTGAVVLLEGKGIVTEAIFSEFENEILFCKANEYTKSSPIGVKAAHDYDIYSINLFSMEVNKLSNLKAYSMHHLFEVDSNYLLAHLYAGEEGGVMLFDKNYPEETKRVEPTNNPRGDASIYHSPIYSKKFNMMTFIAPYQIYTMKMDSKNASLLYDGRGGAHIDYISFFHNEEKLMFVIKGAPNFYVINLDGSGLRKIPVDVNRKI